MRVRNALVLGLSIREALSFWTAHPFDFEIWVRLGYYVSKGFDAYRFTPPIPGLSIPGTGSLPSIGYPPLWPFLEALVYSIYTLVGFGDRFVYYFLLKQQMIIGDVAVAYLLLRVLKNDREAGEKAFTFWMLCPFVVIVSSVWGMFDQLVLALVLVSLILMDRTVRSSLVEFVAIMLKGFPLVFLPALALAQKGTARRLGYVVLAAGLTIVFSLLPYLVLSGWKLSSLFGTGTDIVSKAGNSLNYGVVVYVISNIGMLPAGSEEVWRLAGYLWVPAVLLAYWFCFRKVKRDKVDARFLGLSMLFVTLVYFLTRLNLNEQFVTYFLGFGLLDVLVGGAKRWRAFTGVWLSALVFLVANNAYMVRFLAPISSYFTDLNNSLTGGVPGDARYLLMVVSGLAFTFYSAVYLKSLGSDIKEYRGSV